LTEVRSCANLAPIETKALNMTEDKFSSREVAVLIEDLRSDFRSVSEVVLPLREDMAEVKERLTGVEERLTSVEDALRIAVPDLGKRVSRLESLINN
jgi:hypothetical protein